MTWYAPPNVEALQRICAQTTRFLRASVRAGRSTSIRSADTIKAILISILVLGQAASAQPLPDVQHSPYRSERTPCR